MDGKLKILTFGGLSIRIGEKPVTGLASRKAELLLVYLARLATSSQDGTVRVYSLQIEDLIALAHSHLTRDFTQAECQKYLHMEPGRLTLVNF